MAAPTEVWLVREVLGAIDSREKRIVVIFSGLWCLVLGIRVFGLWFNEVLESGIRETDRNIDKFEKSIYFPLTFFSFGKKIKIVIWQEFIF